MGINNDLEDIDRSLETVERSNGLNEYFFLVETQSMSQFFDLTLPYGALLKNCYFIRWVCTFNVLL